MVNPMVPKRCLLLITCVVLALSGSLAFAVEPGQGPLAEETEWQPGIDLGKLAQKQDCVPTTEAAGSESPLFEPAFASASREKPEDYTAVCTAICTEGPNKTCWGTSCNATDQSCPGTRGQCWGSSTGTRRCDECETSCSATADCSGAGGGTVSCTGTTTCFKIDNCYAYCDGTFNWCSNPPFPCPV